MNSITTICGKKQKTILPSINAQEVNGILYFTVERGKNCKEQWKTDGTANGTVFIAKI
ncbi:MAG: hypothetical protein QNJ72_04785 [Pleurocapsa sp. MO_226.B13]|nr:hypothetical protein [Pleurocapsa sp. MO_226.B13]